MESTLVQIIKEYERFKQHAGDERDADNLSKFVSFLTDQIDTKPKFSEEISIENWQNFNRKTLLEMSVAYIGKMGRYVDNYSRKNLPNTPIGSVEEFTYMIVLLEFPQITKSDLIKRNGHAVTTGTDIIKRLLKKSFVQQIPNPNDKRSYMIELTEAGKGALFASSETMNQLSVIGAGVLSNAELVQLVGMLQKLDAFHEGVHEKHKSLDLGEIIEGNAKALHLED